MLASAARSADAVNVVLGLLRKVVVDDEADILYVDASSGDISRYEHLVLVLLEAVESLAPLSEGSVRVDLGRGRSDISEIVRDVLCAMLGSGEYEDRSARRNFAEGLYEEVEFRATINDDNFLLDVSRRRSRRSHLDTERKLHVLYGELCDLVWHCCREKKRLAGLWDLGHDLLDLRGESNVEHMVSLVEDEN